MYCSVYSGHAVNGSRSFVRFRYDGSKRFVTFVQAYMRDVWRFANRSICVCIYTVELGGINQMKISVNIDREVELCVDGFMELK